jgi:hypothetical protein
VASRGSLSDPAEQAGVFALLGGESERAARG